MKENDNDKRLNKEEEDYQSILKESIEEFEETYKPSDEVQKTIIRKGKNQALLTTIFISLAVLLLIIPVMTLLTYIYYGGINGKANTEIEVAANLIYVTEPNMHLEKMRIEDDIGFFSMSIHFDVFKRIGMEDYRVGDYDIDYFLDRPSFPQRNLLLERPPENIPQPETEFLFHPDAYVPYDRGGEWNILEGLPDGTVSEVYVSFTEMMEPDEVKRMFGRDVEVRWLAVNSGQEGRQRDINGLPITPLGYPAQIDRTTWSPFNGRSKNEDVFIEILELLHENEESATVLARAKSLALEERLSFIKENGIEVYGAVITGPTPELREVQDIDEVRAIKVGEVKLWNWK
ncbi:MULTISPECIES: anti-sigma factor [Bacillaceae]|uniref:Anti-sigma factor n=1 Tax=Evansella alkalicola TaxID=745819 RepID=A0ABS6JW37_9BACI|nr:MULTISPECIES: anti-sigma factor [Bacillaceae]MBU9722807.1 anti-sigma factor [Bacillus alkalicola]